VDFDVSGDSLGVDTYLNFGYWDEKMFVLVKQVIRQTNILTLVA
jgi:hypothetical protein